MSKWEFPPAQPNYMAEIAALAPENTKQVRNQHVVSRVVLKGFSAPARGGKGSTLIPFDIQLGKELKPRGLRGCGKVDNFLSYASTSAEYLWKGVEDKLGPAIQVARPGRFGDLESATEVLKDCIALHLVRSIRYLGVHHNSVTAAIEHVRHKTLNERQPLLRKEFHRRYGLHAAGQEALSMLVDEPIDQWRKMDGALARVSMAKMFDRVRAALRSLSLEVWHVPRGHELLISDSPAFTFVYENDGRLIKPNVAIGDSHGIAMPIACDCLIAIGPATKTEELPVENVVLFNKIQVLVAHRHVYYRPGSRLRTFTESILNDAGVK